MTARRLFFSRAALVIALPLLMLAAALPAAAQDSSEFFLRLNRLENQVRELAGTVEKLEFENRRLQDQLKRFQEDVEFRFQESAPAQPPAKQKRSDLAPDKPPAEDSAVRDIAQTTTPALPASSISDQAVPAVAARVVPAPAAVGAAGTSPAAVEAAGEAEAEAVPAEAVAAVADPAVEPAPVLAYPAGAVAAAVAPDAGRPLDLNAVAGAARARVQHFPQQAEIAPAGLSAGVAQAGIPSVAATAPGDPQQGYREAEASLRRQEFDAAEMGFRQFLQSHPRDRLAPDATYYLGESYFFRGRYREAAEQYLKLTTAFSSSARAPEGMLKLGMSLEALGARDQACATFSETVRKFPAASSDVKQGVARARSRANCA